MHFFDLYIRIYTLKQQLSAQELLNLLYFIEIWLIEKANKF